MSNFSRNLAFIIGINNYTNGIFPLQNAENDAEKLVKLLQKKHNYQVQIYLNELANLNNLNQLLEKILAQEVSKKDRLLFYFAGHGIALNGDDGPAGYLIPQDAKLGDTNTYLPMAKLLECLEKLPCRHFLGILDCCFAGAFRWSSTRDLLTAPEVIYKERYDRFITDPAWQVITSAAYDQTALDAVNVNTQRGQTGNHSPFAAALLEALEGGADIYPPAAPGKPQGDGVITATELYLYLRNAVEPATEGNRQRQTPGIWPLKKHDKGEYIFLSPRHPLNLPPAPPLDASKNPYRGLESFDEEHSELFFGRNELVEKLQVFVKTHPLTVVLGASGSGKSSLVKAGLIPELRKDNTEQWCILPPIRPGETPFQALNNTLNNAQLPEVEPQNLQHNLAWSIDVWAKRSPNSKLLLFIDQTEEIITLCRNEDERKEFFQEILKAIHVHRDRLRLVLTLRSDFETQVRDAGLQFVPTVLKVGNTVLKNWWQSGRFIVSAITRGELREAIEKPAETRVMYFQPHELVEQLIDEVADMPGPLPLLSFALSELYLKYLKRQRDAENRGITIDRALTQKDYQDLGGVIQSLTQRADEEYEALVQENSAYAQIIRHVMLRMVALGGGELARRQVPLSELEYPPDKNGLVKEVIERFTKARLLVEGQDAEGNPYVEPAHDALVQGWQRLLMWKQEEQESLILQRRLTPSAVEWKSQQKVKFLWNADPRLDLLKKLLNSDDYWFNKLEAEFVQCSLSLREKNRRIRMGLFVIAFSIVSVFAFIQWKQNQEAQSINLAASSKTLFASDQQLEALIEGIKAGKKLKWIVLPEANTTHQVVTALHQLVYDSIEYNRLQGEGFLSASFSADGKMLASVSEDGIIQLWSLDGKKINKLDSNLKNLDSISFSPDGTILALGSKDGIIQLWNLDTNEVKIFTSNFKSLDSISFSPDSTILALGSKDGIIQLWNLDTNEAKTFTSNFKSLDSISFSPDGTILALGSKDGIIQLWNLDTNKVKTFTSNLNIVNVTGFSSISFSPDGTMLASVNDNVIELWNTQTGEKIGGNLIGDSFWVSRVSFSHDGKMLASGGYLGIIKVWDTETGKELWSIQGSQGWTGASIIDISFSPVGKILASVDNQFIKLWKLDGEDKPRTLQSHFSGVNSISFSPDSKMLALADEDDKFIELWNLGSGDKPRILQSHFSGVNSITFSPNGKMLASAGDDKFIELWNLDSEDQPRTLQGVSSGVSSISFSPNSKMLASVGNDGNIKLWSLDSNKEPRTLKGDSKEAGVNSVSFSPNGKMLASASHDGNIKLWSLEDNKEVWSLPVEFGPNGIGLRVRFSPDGKILASVISGRFIKLLSIDGKEIRRIKGGFSNIDFSGDSSVIGSIAFSPDSKMLASVEMLLSSADKGDDCIIRLLNLEGRELGRLKCQSLHINSISFSPDGKILASAGEDDIVILWNLDLDDLLRRGCDLIRDYLQNNPNVNDSDRHLCDDVPKQK